jgi:hypothetical protein
MVTKKWFLSHLPPLSFGSGIFKGKRKGSPTLHIIQTVGAAILYDLQLYQWHKEGI